MIDVEQMEPKEAMAQKKIPQKDVVVAELLTQLTFLPLAITQAAAYLNQTKMPTRKYLQLLRGAEKDAARVLGRDFRDATRYRGSQNAVAMTWLVSFDQSQRSNPIALHLLSFMACIEPKAIPQSILPKEESGDLEWAIGTLCGYSFVIRRGDSDMFDMHSLVHIATWEWLGKQGYQEQVREYLPHALRLLHKSDGFKEKERYDLLYNVGKCLDTDRRFKEAVQCFEEVWQKERQNISDNEISESSIKRWLASAYLSDRRIKEAIEILKHMVEVRRQTLDEKDHSRLASEHELARAYLEDRRIKEAIELLKHVVEVEKQTLDEKDHSRLASEHSLASAYLEDRRIKEAIEMFKHVVEVRRQTLDETDHSRLASEHSLASAYLEDRRIKKATEILQYVVEIQRQTLDEKDHSRLASEHSLARAYIENGLPQEALEHVVAIEYHLCASDDPDRAVSADLLERAYNYLGAPMGTSEDESLVSEGSRKQASEEIDLVNLRSNNRLVDIMDKTGT